MSPHFVAKYNNGYMFIIIKKGDYEFLEDVQGPGNSYLYLPSNNSSSFGNKFLHLPIAERESPFRKGVDGSEALHLVGKTTLY